jgi:hypothetical protein
MSSGSRRSRNDPAANEGTSWKVVEIVAEDGKRYNVRWAGKDPITGKPWPLSWVPNSHCSSELIKEWERKKGAYFSAALLALIHMVNHTAKESSLASSSSAQAPVARSRPTNKGNLTKSSESVVPPTRKRKHRSPSNKDDDPKPSRKRKPVSVIESQPGGDLGHGERPPAHSHHTPNREVAPSDAPPHPPFEEIEMWVPTSTAKFGPPKRKHAAAKRRDPPKERPADSIISTVTSVRPQAPLTVSRRPEGLSESQIIALREEEEESQPQPHRSVSRHSLQLGSPGQDSAPSGPLQTLTGDARGEVVENSRDSHPMSQSGADTQPMDRNANTIHVSGLRNEVCHLQDNAIRGGSEDLEISPPLTGPTLKSLVNPEVPAVISPSTKSPLPEKPDPRPTANSTPSSVEQLGPFKDGPLQGSSGTLAERRALEARARLELVRRAASRTTGNLVEGLQSTTQPPPHVVLQQVLSGLESSQSQAAVMENPKIQRVPPSKPREAGLSVQSKEDMVNQDKSEVDMGAANGSPRDNEVINSTTLR